MIRSRDTGFGLRYRCEFCCRCFWLIERYESHVSRNHRAELRPYAGVKVYVVAYDVKLITTDEARAQAATEATSLEVFVFDFDHPSVWL